MSLISCLCKMGGGGRGKYVLKDKLPLVNILVLIVSTWKTPLPKYRKQMWKKIELLLFVKLVCKKMCWKFNEPIWF